MALDFRKVRWGMATLVATANLVVAQAPTAEAQTTDPNANKCRTVFGSFPADYTTFGFTVFDFSSNQTAVAFTATKDQKTLIIGSAFNDTLVNDQGSDAVICGKKGDDSLVQGAGPSLVQGAGPIVVQAAGSGPATIKGGSGRDILGASGGRVSEVGLGGSPDFLEGRGLSALILGETGAGAPVQAFGGEVQIGTGLLEGHGGPGDDRIFGGTNQDTLIGGAGSDSIASESTKGARIFGDQQPGKQLRPNNPGNDTLRGSLGNDTIDGGFGVDSCLGDGGANLITNCEVTDVGAVEPTP